MARASGTVHQRVFKLTWKAEKKSGSSREALPDTRQRRNAQMDIGSHPASYHQHRSDESRQLL